VDKVGTSPGLRGGDCVVDCGLTMDLKSFLYLAALVVFAFGCRTFDSRLLQKLGWFSLLGASYWLAFMLTGSHVAGVCGVLAWFFLPLLEIAGRVRRLRFPMRNEIKGRFAPSREVFPELPDLTSEIEAAGFEEVEDAGWKWHEADHFLRLLYHAERRTQAAISMSIQGDISFSYVNLTSRGKDGKIYTTSNYPFPPTMRFAPGQELNRCVMVESFEALLASHEGFLQKHQVAVTELAEVDPEELAVFLEREMNSQIDHNLEQGLIERLGEGEFRYSWRGCFFLWLQVVKDMLIA
jgi:hypothetical protein